MTLLAQTANVIEVFFPPELDQTPILWQVCALGPSSGLKTAVLAKLGVPSGRGARSAGTPSFARTAVLGLQPRFVSLNYHLFDD